MVYGTLERPVGIVVYRPRRSSLHVCSEVGGYVHLLASQSNGSHVARMVISTVLRSEIQINVMKDEILKCTKMKNAFEMYVTLT